jgi:hypothetical protein
MSIHRRYGEAIGETERLVQMNLAPCERPAVILAHLGSDEVAKGVPYTIPRVRKCVHGQDGKLRNATEWSQIIQSQVVISVGMGDEEMVNTTQALERKGQELGVDVGASVDQQRIVD